MARRLLGRRHHVVPLIRRAVLGLGLGALLVAMPALGQATEPDTTAEGNEAGETDEQDSGSGALDLRQRVASEVLQTNVVLWSAPVVGALGMTDVGDDRVSYGGLYLSPTALLPPRVGEWVAGATAIKTADGWKHTVGLDYEITTNAFGGTGTLGIPF